MDITEIMERIKTLPRIPSLTAQIKCHDCNDTGWIEVDPVTRAVKKCPCRLAREAEARLRASGLADAINAQTFDTFAVETDTQRKMRDVARAYVGDVLAAQTRKPWLYIGGNPGSGKTHICTAVCGELLRHNVAVRYMQWVDVARQLKACINDECFDELIADYVNVSVLYIDDLLKQRYTERPAFSDADIKLTFAILNARYLLDRATIISTEWDLINDLLPADEGVFSRVYERCKRHRVMIPRDARQNYRLRA